MIDVSLLPVFLAAVLLLMITPGPDMVFVTANALGGGRRAGFTSLMGGATATYLHILAAAVAPSAILVASGRPITSSASRGSRICVTAASNS
jgi:threonine/homoserine/homoserine lactone efflux protein